MRTMYDAVTASNIPASAAMVAGYCDTIKIPQWTTGDWARFPHAVKVRITKKPSTNDGHVGDCETGDMTAAQLVDWVLLRRAHGADPTGYCSAAAWPGCKAAFAARHVPEPHWWIAHYDNDPTIPAGAVAKQYKNGPLYDTSVVADYWPGVDSTPLGGISMADAQSLTDLINLVDAHENGRTAQILNAVTAGNADVKAAITAEQVAVVNAVHGVSAAPTETQIAEITAALVKALPGYTVNIVPAH